MRSFFLSLLVLFLLCGLTSCDVQKRLYRNGFYWDLPGGKATTQTTPPAEAVEVESSVNEETGAPETEVTSTTEAASDTARVESTADTSAVVQNQPEAISHPDRVFEKPSVKEHAAAPIRKDKQQAVAAGVAAAIFFGLGMAGLIVKGTAPPAGVFIIAAFVCFIACVMLASFLYPREPVVKQPKDSTAITPMEKVGIALLVIAALIMLSMVGLVGLIFFF